MSGSLGIWIIFILGIIVGGVFFSKEFRTKFFTGLKKFLSGVSKTNLNTRNKEREQKPPIQREYEQKGEHIYVHHIEEKEKIFVCPTCKGSGQVYENVPNIIKGAPGFNQRIQECPTCKGSGKVYQE